MLFQLLSILLSIGIWWIYIYYPIIWLIQLGYPMASFVLSHRFHIFQGGQRAADGEADLVELRRGGARPGLDLELPALPLRRGGAGAAGTGLGGFGRTGRGEVKHEEYIYDIYIIIYKYISTNTYIYIIIYIYIYKYTYLSIYPSIYLILSTLIYSNLI